MLLTKVGRGCLRWTIVCALGPIVLAGCGGTKRLPVAGTVTLDGKPLDDVIITFAPDAAKGNAAQITCKSPVKEGRYELQTTGITRADSGSGVPPGWYKVIVRPQPKNPFAQVPATVPNKAGTSKRGQLLAGQKQRNRTPRPPKNPNPFPTQYSSVEKTPFEVEVKDNPASGAYDFSLKSR